MKPRIVFVVNIRPTDQPTALYSNKLYKYLNYIELQN